MFNTQRERHLFLTRILSHRCQGDPNQLAQRVSSHATTPITTDAVNRWPSLSEPIGDGHIALLEACFQKDLEEIQKETRGVTTSRNSGGVSRELDPEAVRLLKEFEKMPTQVRQDLRDMVKVIIDKNAAKGIPK